MDMTIKPQPMKIKWNKTLDIIPDHNRRILLKLSDGRVCSARANDEMGIELEHISEMDLIHDMFTGESQWLYLDKE